MPEARKVTPDEPGRPETGEVADIGRVCAEIIAGRHTGRLTEILEAVVHAATDGPSSLRWRLKLSPLGPEFDGVEVSEDSISLQAVVTAERFSGHSWKTLSPAESAADCHAIIVGWLVEDQGHKMPEALAIAKRVSLRDVLEMLDTYEVVHADPKEDEIPSGPATG